MYSLVFLLLISFSDNTTAHIETKELGDATTTIGPPARETSAPTRELPVAKDHSGA